MQEYYGERHRRLALPGFQEEGMTHKHEYEISFRPSISQEAGEMGIKAAEMRKCKSCGKEMTFVLLGEDWIPLFDEKERDERDILLA